MGTSKYVEKSIKNRIELKLLNKEVKREKVPIFPFDKPEASELYFLTMLTITLESEPEPKDKALWFWQLFSAYFKDDLDFLYTQEK